MVTTQRLSQNEGEQRKLTQSLVDHVDSMDQAAKNVLQLNQQLQISMSSYAGRTLNDRIQKWTESYNVIKGKVNEVINNLGAAKNQIQQAEEDNQAMATKFGDGMYQALSKPNN